MKKTIITISCAFVLGAVVGLSVAKAGMSFNSKTCSMLKAQGHQSPAAKLQCSKHGVQL